MHATDGAFVMVRSYDPAECRTVFFVFFFQAEDGIRDYKVTGVQTCALPICAVVGSTLTTVLVFVPLAFIVGVYGQFFAALSWSLSIAVLVSMVISLTLIPVFAAKFLAGRPMPAPGRVYRAVARGYDILLARALRAPWLVIGA